MADDVAAIPSAVVIPTKSELQLETSDVSRHTKRRQTSSPEPSSKRSRLAAEGALDSPSTVRASPNASPKESEPVGLPPKVAPSERLQSNAQEERKRGKRLFGGLLNTLSQSASNTQQKKRLEVERRQQEKARLQKAEDEARREEKLQKLKEIRLQEQVKFDDQSMRIRHSNMLAMAQFLHTKCEPKLYYKPWELLPGDADRIREQIDETEALIEREVQEFKVRHNVHLSPEELPLKDATDSAGDAEGEHQAEPPPIPLVVESDSTNPLPHIQGADSDHAHVSTERDPLEDNGEVLVEGDEDTVIY